MRTFKLRLDLVKRIIFPRSRDVKLSLVKNSVVLGSAEQAGPESIKCILNPLHIANLISVIRWNRNFLYAKAGPEQLNNNFGVKMKVVGVAIERKPFEGLNRVQAIAATELGQGTMQDQILNISQSLIANVFV